jgi:hypothetical protein
MAAVPPAAVAAPVIAPSREIRLNLPSVFDGSRNKFKHFHQATLLYLSVNRHIFQTDEQKIAFTLSYLAEKEAAQWRDSWVGRSTDATTGDIVYPTWAVFIAELVHDFSPVDEVGDAMHALQTLRQGSKTAEDVSVEWALLVTKARIASSERHGFANPRG